MSEAMDRANEGKTLMNKVVRLLLVAEIHLDEATDIYGDGVVTGQSLEGDARQVLDAFREAVLPARDYAVVLYRTTPQLAAKLFDKNGFATGGEE